MRIILIVQSLIILGGAYYVYTLAHPPATPTETNTPAPASEVEVRVVPADDKSETHTQTTEAVATTTSVTITEGHNDTGMEFPIPDDEAVLEVR